jgi:hypothetical protein
MAPKTLKDFFNLIEEKVRNEENFKITFSKPRNKQDQLSNVYLRQILVKNTRKHSLQYKYQRRDEVKNYNSEDILEIIEDLLTHRFYNAVVFTTDQEVTLMQNPKGKVYITVKNISEEVEFSLVHDREKNRFIPENRRWLLHLGLAGKDGRILDKAQDKYRQINKFVEIIDNLLQDVPEGARWRIADMGSGKGYLTFALYDYLTQIRKINARVTGFEMREELVTKCYEAAMQEQFLGLAFQAKDIDHVDVKGMNMVIALHACDTATDLAISKGIRAGAQFILVSPCCHKQIRKDMKHNNALSPILQHGILEERQAEILTDGMRALIMEANGYKTRIIEFISSEHTGKNLMIIGEKSKPDPKAMEKVQAIKAMFGISEHYLEVLMSREETGLQM